MGIVPPNDERARFLIVAYKPMESGATDFESAQAEMNRLSASNAYSNIELYQWQPQSDGWGDAIDEWTSEEYEDED
ncbi:hypothetical protein [Sulfitobacter sp. PS-8MA]|uniref:hypothetical protein n=1 Tax=Sulfitobacter sp. PS-8MA TaxID=3237707 RepID=UPI0034C6B351